MNNFVFDPNEQLDTTERARVMCPEGWHTGRLKDHSWVANKAGTGHYLQYWVDITNGEGKGAHFPIRLNLDNPSEQAVLIAKQTLQKICRAVGHTAPLTNMAALENIPLKMLVTVREFNNTQYNDAKAFAAVDDAKAVTRASVPMPGWMQAAAPSATIEADDVPF